MPLRFACVGCTALVVLTIGLRAQAPPPQSLPPITASDSRFDQAAVERGSALLVSQCGFCHGSNARGGPSGPDLTRSALVQDDEEGRQLGEFLATGRPDKGMPAFDLAADAGVRPRDVSSCGDLPQLQPPPLPDSRYPHRRSESRRGLLRRRRQMRRLPFRRRRPEGRRRQVRRRRCCRAACSCRAGGRGSRDRRYRPTPTRTRSRCR